MLIRCRSDPFDHIINSCGLCFDNTIMLVMGILDKLKYITSNEIYDCKIRVPLTEDEYSSVEKKAMIGARTHLYSVHRIVCNSSWVFNHI
jgi:hypothetical protein